MYIFTHHAIEQFKKRMIKLNQLPEENPIITLQKFINKAIEEQIDPIEKVKRLINHKFQETKYLVTEGWRFIVTLDNIVLTVERVNKYQN